MINGRTGHEISNVRRASAAHAGVEAPAKVVESLGQGKRPRVTITINGHSWKSRVAIMRGRFLLGPSIANRQAAGVDTGDGGSTCALSRVQRSLETRTRRIEKALAALKESGL